MDHPKHFCGIALAAMLALPVSAADFQLRLIGATSVATGTQFQGVEFGGISGIDRAADGSYWAISDDRGGERGTPRFYNLSLNYDGAGFAAASAVVINGQVNMQRPDGSSFPASSRTVDPEGLRVAPNGNLYWSSEGNWSASAGARYQPFVREMRTDGSFVREFATPSMYQYVDNSSTGGRSNKLFEALAVTPGGMLYTANEDALIQDGDITTLNAGSVVRLSALDPASGLSTAQYAYQLPAIPVAGNSLHDNGLPELLALDDSSFIAVERAWAQNVGNTIRLVLTRITPETTDVSGLASLAGAAYTPMTRELLLEMPLSFEGVMMDNIEAISWGQTRANGHRTLVLAADNNFAANQVTQFIALEVMPVPEPGSWALLLAGLGLVAGLARRGARRR